MPLKRTKGNIRMKNHMFAINVMRGSDKRYHSDRISNPSMVSKRLRNPFVLSAGEALQQITL
nr:unnamed protein product [Callosobruchus analis]